MRKRSTYRPRPATPPMLVNRGPIETGHKLLPGQSGSERTGSGTKTVTAMPGVTVTQHKMRG